MTKFIVALNGFFFFVLLLFLLCVYVKNHTVPALVLFLTISIILVMLRNNRNPICAALNLDIIIRGI